MTKRCTHRKLEVKTEGDRCSWVQCTKCGKAGPAKHSYTLALLAWIMTLANDRHPPIRITQLYGGPANIPSRNPFRKAKAKKKR